MGARCSSRAVILSLVLAAPALSQVRTVALNGDSAVGVGGANFSQFLPSYSVINNLGEVAFFGITALGASSNGVWSESGGLHLVARQGQAAPGLGGPTFLTFSGKPFVLSDQSSTGGPGATAFLQGTTFGFGIWMDLSGTLTPLALDAQAAPGSPPGNFQSLGDGVADPVITSGGVVAFNGSYSTTSPPFLGFNAIWSGVPGALVMGARTTGDLVSDGFFNFSDPSYRDGNAFATFATERQSGVLFNGVYTGAAGALAPLVLVQQQAPGMDPGVTFADFGTFVSVNVNGSVAFTALVQGTGVGIANNWSVWSDSGLPLGLRAREGQELLPGVAIGDNALLDGQPVASDYGNVVFITKLAGAGVTAADDNAVVEVLPAGCLRIVCREGQECPGIPGSSITAFNGDVATNARGQMLFAATIAGGVNSRVLLGTDTGGRLVLVHREGNQHEIRPGMQATIGVPANALRTGGGDGWRSNLNDVGQCVFASTWAQVGGGGNGQGVFVMTIPCGEPGGGCCDGIDFNSDGVFPDVVDLIEFLGVFSGAACSLGCCGDVDVNNDGVFPDTVDLQAFLRIFSGGVCPV